VAFAAANRLPVLCGCPKAMLTSSESRVVPRTAAKALRFGLVGALNGLVFAAVTLLANGWLDPTFSSFLGYAVAIPIAFLGHRNYTFRSDGIAALEFRRFAVSSLIGLATSVGAMFVAAEVLGWPTIYGIAAAIVLAPAISYLLCDLWVFTDKAERTPPRSKTR
jgi:putative flippase GtrA